MARKCEGGEDGGGGRAGSRDRDGGEAVDQKRRRGRVHWCSGGGSQLRKRDGVGGDCGRRIENGGGGEVVAGISINADDEIKTGRKGQGRGREGNNYDFGRAKGLPHPFTRPSWVGSTRSNLGRPDLTAFFFVSFLFLIFFNYFSELLQLPF